MEERHTMAEVLSRRRTVRQSLQTGPHGIQILPGAWGLDVMADCSADAQDRLVTQLRGLGPDVDAVVIDVGSGTSSLVKRFWKAADEILLVTTPDLTSVMDTYATAKVLAAGDDSLRIRPVVNLAPDPGAAQSVHARLARAFYRFLGIRLLPAGHAPHDQRLQQGWASVKQLKELAERVLEHDHAFREVSRI
jgi:flagellar biosynthesis protein FlhG